VKKYSTHIFINFLEIISQIGRKINLNVRKKQQEVIAVQKIHAGKAKYKEKCNYSIQSYIPFGDNPLKSYSIKRYSKAEFHVYFIKNNMKKINPGIHGQNWI
jgi:hypothetical protein